MISEAEKKFLKTGYKQTMKVLSNGKGKKVYIAEDCEERFKASVLEAAEKNGAEVCYVQTMKDLGALCGITLGASCAVVVNF